MLDFPPEVDNWLDYPEFLSLLVEAVGLSVKDVEYLSRFNKLMFILLRGILNTKPSLNKQLLEILSTSKKDLLFHSLFAKSQNSRFAAALFISDNVSDFPENREFHIKLLLSFFGRLNPREHTRVCDSFFLTLSNLLSKINAEERDKYKLEELLLSQINFLKRYPVTEPTGCTSEKRDKLLAGTLSLLRFLFTIFPQLKEVET